MNGVSIWPCGGSESVLGTKGGSGNNFGTFAFLKIINKGETDMDGASV